MTIIQAGQLAGSPETKLQLSIHKGSLGPYLSARICAFASWVSRCWSTSTCRIAETQHTSGFLAHRACRQQKRRQLQPWQRGYSHFSLQDSCDLYGLHRGHHLIQVFMPGRQIAGAACPERLLSHAIACNESATAVRVNTGTEHQQRYSCLETMLPQTGKDACAEEGALTSD